MNYNIYFSPTGSTQKITTYVSDQFGRYENIDLSIYKGDYTKQFETDDICIVGVPSFGGRVPAIAIKRLMMMKGNQTPAILISTYGNRAYEDTLLELKTTLNQNGFICIGAMAIVCEHSIMHEFAKEKPYDEDFKEISHFTDIVKMRLKESLIDIDVPGNIPFREYNGIPLKPKTTKKCTECGLCGKLCPVGAIPFDNPHKTDKNICISCMRCVAKCPHHARKCNELMIAATTKKLKNICEIAKKNDFF